MTSQFKSFLKFVANAAVVVLVVAIIVPGVYKATKKIPFTIAGTGGVGTVNASDTDNAIFGLDGNDFTVTWVPSGTAPAGYTGTKIYIVPNANNTISSDNLNTNGCGGSACLERGYFLNYSQNSYTLPGFFASDSHGTVWNAATTYKACIFTDATTNYLDCSSGVTVAAEDEGDVADMGGSFISHMNVANYISGQKLTTYAIIDDDQTSTSDFQAGTGGAAVQMKYGIAANAVTSTANGSLQAGTSNLWKFETTATHT
ncbi:MAG: hypothetical protein V1760_00985, partial [Candidatus Peregrinibacteria bacterium]